MDSKMNRVSRTKISRIWPLAFLCLSLLPTSGCAEEKTKDAAKNAQQAPAKTDAKSQKADSQSANNQDANNQDMADAAAPKAPTKEELFAPASISRLSETYGHLINKGLDNPVLKLDFDAVVKGMTDARAGKPAPMTEQEYEESINLLQEYAYQDLANRNLQEAEKFLKENAKKEGVKEIEAGKIQYLTLQDGKGEVVTEDMIPSITYKGQYLDGTVFGSSDANKGPISLSLKQTIPGFRRGILGMKVGEKRRIFIHPEQGYGTSGQLLPNALLIFDIEVTGVKPEPKEKEKANEKAAGETKLSDAELDADADDDMDDAEDLQLADGETLFPDELGENENEFEEDENNNEDHAEDYEQDDFATQPQDDLKKSQ